MLCVTEPVLIELIGRHTVEEALVLGDEVIIGQTILEKTDLHVDCRNRRLLPNPAHPDQPVLEIKFLRSLKYALTHLIVGDYRATAGITSCAKRSSMACTFLMSPVCISRTMVPTPSWA